MWDKGKKDDMDLIFIYDKLLVEEVQCQLKIPMEFVSFAYIEGYKLFHYRKSYVAVKNEDCTRTWGNDRVYGAVYRVKKLHAYLALLDAYYYYLPSQIGDNKHHNLRLRVSDNVQLFTIQTLDDLLTYRFKPHKAVKCVCYIGNNADKRLIRHIQYRCYRITDGIDKVNYNQLLKQTNIL